MKKLDLRSTMSSPMTGILSLIRFDSGQDYYVIIESPQSQLDLDLDFGLVRDWVWV